mmetsp:Transcript_25970/g.29717  ORF Transcript_25970/g.29717 Transcript_25970/m.29717 type:complete len:80 (+) Transcript_25970:1664-1903(+)
MFMSHCAAVAKPILYWFYGSSLILPLVNFLFIPNISILPMFRQYFLRADPLFMLNQVKVDNQLDYPIDLTCFIRNVNFC